jgi:serine/threonine-protein kinase
VIGRAPDVDLSVPADTAMSRRHARVELREGRLLVHDLGSRHGTFVNGSRITSPTAIRTGDTMQVGETMIAVSLAQEASTAATILESSARGERTTLGVEMPRAATSAMLPSGYTYVRVLGSGAMGTVYLARHTATGTERALKLIKSARVPPQLKAMFLREADVQAALVHPGIVRVYELLEPEPDTFCIAMEYVEGCSGDALLARGVLEPARVVALGVQILDALEYAHGRGVVHRDIKESNLLVDAAGAAKLADFGLAKNFQTAGMSGITSDGSIGGTIPYMPPEQLIDYRYVKPPADIFALGATLYRLLTATFVRDFAPDENLIVTALERPIVPLRARNPSLPLALCAVIEKALALDVNERYGSAAVMRRDLATVAI